jgi:glycine/D-amino acid oxidase-like deaminating enzyme
MFALAQVRGLRYVHGRPTRVVRNKEGALDSVDVEVIDKYGSDVGEATLLPCDDLVVAAGPWTGQVLAKLNLPPLAVGAIPSHGIVVDPPKPKPDLSKAEAEADSYDPWPPAVVFATLHGVNRPRTADADAEPGLQTRIPTQIKTKMQPHPPTPTGDVWNQPKESGSYFDHKSGSNPNPNDSHVQKTDPSKTKSTSTSTPKPKQHHEPKRTTELIEIHPRCHGNENTVYITGETDAAPLPDDPTAVDDLVDPQIARRLVRAMRLVSSRLAEGKLRTREVSYRAVLPDNIPAVGELESGVWVATGKTLSTLVTYIATYQTDGTSTLQASDPGVLHSHLGRARWSRSLSSMASV